MTSSKNSLSPCCRARLDSSRGDGVTIGSCSKCDASCCRVNPRTGVEEWLDGASPWDPGDLRPMTPEFCGKPCDQPCCNVPRGSCGTVSGCDMLVGHGGLHRCEAAMVAILGPERRRPAKPPDSCVIVPVKVAPSPEAAAIGLRAAEAAATPPPPVGGIGIVPPAPAELMREPGLEPMLVELRDGLLAERRRMWELGFLAGAEAMERFEAAEHGGVPDPVLHALDVLNACRSVPRDELQRELLSVWQAGHRRGQAHERDIKPSNSVYEPPAVIAEVEIPRPPRAGP